ncbi:MAG: PLP-dependent aspartate aminotransferase family protein [Polyangiales bacterium]
MSDHTPRQLRTIAVHAGRDTGDGLVGPIHRSSTYLLGKPETFDDIRYTRLNNTPSQVEVETAIGALEQGVALVTPSGTAAVHLALNLFKPGDHLLAARRLYGGTRKLLEHHAERMGLRTTFVELDDPSSWAAAAEESTRGFLVETVANPWMSVPPLGEVVAFCKARDLTSMIDNTLASPVLYQPRAHGFDVVIHSASKHINGHTDVVAGALISDAERTRALRLIANRLGICPDPQACYLLRRGIKTLPLRVKAQCDSALQIATWLQRHPAVEKVLYPGLEDSAYRARASASFAGLFGTMLTFVPAGGVAAAEALIERLQYATEAPSLGGVETLITRPATTSHGGLSAEYRSSIGIDDAMVRLSVGVEDTADLIADLEQALGSGVVS